MDHLQPRLSLITLQPVSAKVEIVGIRDGWMGNVWCTVKTHVCSISCTKPTSTMLTLCTWFLDQVRAHLGTCELLKNYFLWRDMVDAIHRTILFSLSGLVSMSTLTRWCLSHCNILENASMFHEVYYLHQEFGQHDFPAMV